MCADCSSKSNPDLPRRWNWPWTWWNGSYARLGCRATSALVRTLTSNPPAPRAAENVAYPVAGHLGFIAEAQSATVHEGSISNRLYGGFSRDFATANRERVMVAALTPAAFRRSR